MQAAATSPRAWLTDTLWLGGLAAAAALAWRALAAHPAAQLAVAGYLAVETLFYLWGRERWVGLPWWPVLPLASTTAH